ncbi:unnamed protein product [Penicillium palitans]
MSSRAARLAFNFYTDVRGQLETAGTNYFDPFVAIPGTRAHIHSVSGFMPALVATATYVESENTEIVLGEHIQFESALEMVYVKENLAEENNYAGNC